jgi:transcriptional regulator GlxA family with amidase domain
MSPTQYVLLRRFGGSAPRAARANPHNANVAEIAHRFGFVELQRFSETYQATFGEAPLTTLQHVP